MNHSASHPFCRNTAAVLIALAVLAARPANAANCEDLARLDLSNTTIRSAKVVGAGEFKPQSDAQGAAYTSLGAFCRVEGVIKPSSDSHISFEVWMPASGWNGRFMGVGNGGFAGSINYAGLANSVANGYATASTDTGHSQGGVEAGWALGHREKVIDYGYRGIHEMTEKAKAIVNAFYSDAPRYSYFHSCSNGGRQALMEAQRYPGDYDGIISGAPANNFTRLLMGFAWNTQALSKPGAHIPPAKIPAIADAALAACDAGDGVSDGLISEPDQCEFDALSLLCEGAENDRCLTKPQAEALAKIYAGPTNSKGEQIFPGFPPGAETGRGGWLSWVTGAAPGESLQAAFATQFFSNMVYENPKWTIGDFDFDRDVAYVEDKMGPVVNATNPDLSAFRDGGGRLIIYHGWGDAAIPAQSAIDYYDSVVSKMGAEEARSFVRLFLAPGVQHCSGGPGPNSFGEYPGPAGDAANDVVKALERWVEEGVAPEKILATKYHKDGDRNSGVVRRRPLCSHPQTAQFKGSGSADDAASFSCTE